MPWWDYIGAFRFKPEKWDASERLNMTTNFALQTSDEKHCSVQSQMIDALTNVRLDWELAANGKSLLHHEGAVGLILFDIVTKLNVPLEEQRFLLGPVLFDEIAEFVTKHG